MTLHLDLLERPSSADPKRTTERPFHFMPTPLLTAVPSRRHLRARAMAPPAVPFSSNLGMAATLTGASSILFLQLLMLGVFFLSL